MRLATNTLILFLLSSGHIVASLPSPSSSIRLPLEYVKRVHPQSSSFVKLAKRQFNVSLNSLLNDATTDVTSAINATLAKETLDVPLINDADLNELAIRANIGTPAQSFYFLFDTGSADTWVPSKQCTASTGCPDFIQHFDSDSSTTYQSSDQHVRIAYGIGSANGSYFNDVFSFQDSSLTLPDQTLAMMDRSEGPLSTQSNETGVDDVFIDGIFGAGLPGGTIRSLQQKQAYDPPIVHLYKKGLISHPVFSVNIQDQSGGHVLLGDMDLSSASADKLVYANVPRIQGVLSHWAVSLKGMQFQNANASTNFFFNHNTVFGVDTGSNFMYLPKTLAHGLVHAISGKPPVMDDKSQQTYVVDCSLQESNTILNLFFDNSQSITLPIKHLVAKRSSDKQCLLLFVASENNFILGNMFLRHFVTVFDFGDTPRIGFAPLKEDLEGEKEN